MAIKPQIITTAGGSRLAVLELEDYERLAQAYEDLEDIADYEAFKRKLAAGEEELIPAEIAYRLLDEKESKLMVWREYRGLTVKALAEKVGISPSYLSQIEHGKREGTLSTMRKITEALNITLEDI